VWTGPGDDEHHIAVQAIGAAEYHLLVKGGDAPSYAAKIESLLYTHGGELFAVRWHPSQTDLGKAVPVAAPESPNDGFNEGSGNYDVSEGGTLAYLADGRTRKVGRLVWIDRAGRPEPAPVPEHKYENVVISPDGSRVFYRGTRQGTRNLNWRSADGSGDDERLTSKPDVVQTPTSVSADGRWLMFSEGGPNQPGGTGVWLMGLEGDRSPRPFFQEPAGESDGQISPDGRWVAYQVPVSSRQEIYVAPFPGPGARHQISTDGGTEPLWSRDGRELFFQSGTQLVAVTISPGAAFSAGTPRLVHEGRYFRTINGNTSWSLTPDGNRFLRIQNVEPERAITRLELVLNWFAELEQRGAAGGK
jgi:serine/threonine-protein kinase